MLKEDGDYRAYLLDPDVPVKWDKVEEIVCIVLEIKLVLNKSCIKLILVDWNGTGMFIHVMFNFKAKSLKTTGTIVINLYYLLSRKHISIYV